MHSSEHVSVWAENHHLCRVAGLRHGTTSLPVNAAPAQGPASGLSPPQTHPLCSGQASLHQRILLDAGFTGRFPLLLCKRLIDCDQCMLVDLDLFREARIELEAEGPRSGGRTGEWNSLIFWDLSEI